MKKILLLILLSLTFSFFHTTQLHAVFRLNYEVRETSFYHNVRHTYLEGTVQYNNQVTKQRINYLGANISTLDDVSIIVGDTYSNHGWGRGTLIETVDNIHNRYDDYKVIGGVNGDFYGSFGIPIEAYVRNYEILSNGLNVNRTVVGFKDDGSIVFGRPEYLGYELLVLNGEGNIKYRQSLDGINSMPADEHEITVYFENYKDLINPSYQALLIHATETKFDSSNRTYFAKGNVASTVSESTALNEHEFLLVGNLFTDELLIRDSDTVLIQERMGGEFENVRYAIGAWEELVKDGKAKEEHTEGAGPTFRHPRTAVGVTGDGTIFFVTVDGRDYDNFVLGVTAYEMAEIMLYFGAEHAYNLDGGGSSAMITSTDFEHYTYMNTPSDGQPRETSNGLFFVKGTHPEKPRELPYPDLRTVLNPPTNLRINTHGTLSFNPVEDASSYEVILNDTSIPTKDTTITLPLIYGENLLRLRTIGDYETTKKSLYSEEVTYYHYSESMHHIINVFKHLGIGIKP